MRLGAAFSNVDMGLDFGAMRDAAQALEEAGFASISCNDHVVGGHPDRAEGQQVHTSATAVHEPLVLLSFLGAVTARVELATSILILPQRPTALVAKQVAELDLLSGGRVRLGVGIGRNWMEYEALGQPFADRGRRLEEQVEVLRRLWTEEHVTFSGRWHELDRIGIQPLPQQRPVPIWMGNFVGTVVERVIERIGRLADGWMAQMPPTEEFSAVLERIRGYATAAGRDPDALGVECAVRIKHDDDPARWLAVATAYRNRGATALKAVSVGGQARSAAQHLETLLAWRNALAEVADLRS